MDEMDEIVQEFLVESHENLDQLDRDLVALEQQPDSRDLLSSIFRTIHTIKGTSGFLAFGRLERLTHAGESLLSRLRDGTQSITLVSADALLRMVDTVRALLAEIEATGTDGEIDIDSAMEAVTACIEDLGSPAGAKPAAPPASPAVEPAVATPELLAAASHAGSGPADPAPGSAAALPGGSVVSGPAREAEPAADEPAGPSSTKRSVADSSIRVDVDLLDTLMRLVGELVLTRNQLILGVGDSASAALTRTTQRLEPDHQRAAGERHEDAHAADRTPLGEAAQGRP